MSEIQGAVLTLFLMLSGYTTDKYHLARAIAGECPHLVTADRRLAERVGQVALNRLGAGWCATMEQCVAEGFWGALTVTIPPAWAFEAAQAVMERNETTDDFYVFSKADTEELDLPLSGANFYRCAGAFCLAFYGRDTRW